MASGVNGDAIRRTSSPSSWAVSGNSSILAFLHRAPDAALGKDIMSGVTRPGQRCQGLHGGLERGSCTHSGFWLPPSQNAARMPAPLMMRLRSHGLAEPRSSSCTAGSASVERMATLCLQQRPCAAACCCGCVAGAAHQSCSGRLVKKGFADPVQGGGHEWSPCSTMGAHAWRGTEMRCHAWERSPGLQQPLLPARCALGQRTGTCAALQGPCVSSLPLHGRCCQCSHGTSSF